jgi:DNA-binding response OmpR family regulator
MAKIILIEDDATMVSLLGTFLQMEGFQTVKLKNERTVEQILELMRKEKPDLALLDLHIYQISGLDVLRQIRKDPDVRTTRVVMSSGSSVRDECFLAGANDFVMKPYMPDDLIKTIRKILEAK